MDSNDNLEKEPIESSWRQIAPGLVYILLIDLLAVLGWWEKVEWLHPVWVLPLVVLPWLSMLASPNRIKLMGFHHRRWIAMLGWGMVAGGIWRILSLVLNMVLSESGFGQLGWGDVVSAAFIVPGIEETFFRGYLGRGLSRQLGLWPGVLVQAGLFSLHPIHWVQGGVHLISIFGFGLLAGWMVEQSRSIWPAWGAHAMANLLPLLMPSYI